MTDEESRLYEQTRGELARLLDQAGPCRDQVAAVVLESLETLDQSGLDIRRLTIARTAMVDAIATGGRK